MALSFRSPEHPLVLPPRADTEAIARAVLARATAPRAQAQVLYAARAKAQGTRGVVRAVEGVEGTSVGLRVDFNRRYGEGGLNRLDDDGIVDFVTALETSAKQSAPRAWDLDLPPAAVFTDPPIYHDATLALGDPEWQGEVLRRMMAHAAEAGLVGAADVAVTVEASLLVNTKGVVGYTRRTYGAVSMTARTRSGKGSGWAWDGAHDFATVDPMAIARTAVDIGARSDNPVAVEPGRYTVILEPAAVAGLLSDIVAFPTEFMGADAADGGRTVFSKKGGGNKIGLQMMDGRARFITDPMDPLVPYSPFSTNPAAMGAVLKRMDWFSEGILRDLWYWADYATAQHREPNSMPGNPRLELTGPTGTLEEMIASTKRGIWVHRFHVPETLFNPTLIMSGVTRDGTFLIENGKITKPIKNLRFLESPFFVLNKIDAFGKPERAMGKSRVIAAPRLKVHDFEFISLSDAV